MGFFGNRYSQGAGRVPTNPLTVGEKELNESRTRFPAPSTNPVVTAPQLPGGSMGNMGYDPLPGMLGNNSFKNLYYSLDEKDRPLLQQFFAREGTVKGFDLNKILSDRLANKRTDLEIAELEAKLSNDFMSHGFKLSDYLDLQNDFSTQKGFRLIGVGSEKKWSSV